jgi:putative hydrolase of the HAD superfamily
VSRPPRKGRPVEAILFDLDDTLIEEERAAAASFAATGLAAAGRRALDGDRLGRAARRHAKALWLENPVHPFCREIGISSWEGLWCRFEGSGEELGFLREWSPTYRLASWHRALLEQDVDDPTLAVELGERFGRERRSRHVVFPDAVRALERWRGVPLGLLTNGASCLQREKIAGSGLGDRFDAVIVSGDLGIGKPDPAIFLHAVERLGVDPKRAVMVGDSYDRDVVGALMAGLRAVWLRRGDPAEPAFGRPPAPRITSLDELDEVLGRPAPHQP